jgi:hypothetical protein
MRVPFATNVSKIALGMAVVSVSPVIRSQKSADADAMGIMKITNCGSESAEISLNPSSILRYRHRLLLLPPRGNKYWVFTKKKTNHLFPWWNK